MIHSTRRKEKSEAQLRALDVAININLPVTRNEDEVILRTKEEIVNRIIPLTIVSAKAMEAPVEKLEEFIERYNAYELFTVQERNYLLNQNPEHSELIQYSWKPECIWILLWSLSLLPKLDVPADLCNPNFIFDTVFHSSKQELLEQSTVRSASEVIDELDFIYRAHWAVREAQLKYQPIPVALNASVVYERHYALNWLVNYMEQEWDSVSTDT